MLNKKTETVADVLFNVFRILKPLYIMSDRGPEFTGDDTRQVCKIYGVYQLFTHPYKPLGVIERFNQTIKKKLFSMMEIYNNKRYLPYLHDLV